MKSPTFLICFVLLVACNKIDGNSSAIANNNPTPVIDSGKSNAVMKIYTGSHHVYIYSSSYFKLLADSTFNDNASIRQDSTTLKLCLNIGNRNFRLIGFDMPNSQYEFTLSNDNIYTNYVNHSHLKAQLHDDSLLMVWYYLNACNQLEQYDTFKLKLIPQL